MVVGRTASGYSNTLAIWIAWYGSSRERCKSTAATDTARLRDCAPLPFSMVGKSAVIAETLHDIRGLSGEGACGVHSKLLRPYSDHSGDKTHNASAPGVQTGACVSELRGLVSNFVLSLYQCSEISAGPQSRIRAQFMPGRYGEDIRFSLPMSSRSAELAFCAKDAAASDLCMCTCDPETCRK